MDQFIHVAGYLVFHKLARTTFHRRKTVLFTRHLEVAALVAERENTTGVRKEEEKERNEGSVEPCTLSREINATITAVVGKIRNPLRLRWIRVV